MKNTKLTIRIDEETRSALKKLVIDKKTNVNQLMVDYIRKLLKKTFGDHWKQAEK